MSKNKLSEMLEVFKDEESLIKACVPEYAKESLKDTDYAEYNLSNDQEEALEIIDGEVLYIKGKVEKLMGDAESALTQLEGLYKFFDLVKEREEKLKDKALELAEEVEEFQNSVSEVTDLLAMGDEVNTMSFLRETLGIPDSLLVTLKNILERNV